MFVEKVAGKGRFSLLFCRSDLNAVVGELGGLSRMFSFEMVEGVQEGTALVLGHGKADAQAADFGGLGRGMGA